MRPSRCRSLLALPLLAAAATAQAPLYDIRGAAWDEWATSIADVGDLDGDGLRDVAIGAPGGFSDAGYVRVISTRTAVTLLVLYGEDPGDRFGTSIAGLGDVDGDGVPDLAVGATGVEWNPAIPNRGAVTIHSGVDGSLIRTFTGNVESGGFGASVVAIGDVSGDGAIDLAISQPWDDTNGSGRGRVYVVSGDSSWVIYSVLGQSAGDLFGFALDAAGDVDGDGVGDVVVGAPYWGSTNAGRGYVLSGATGQIVLARTGSTANMRLGISAGGGADVNGDGTPDAIFGAPYDDANGATSGTAVVVSGAAPHGTLWVYAGAQADQALGYKVDLSPDMNGDGVGEVVLGIPEDGPSDWGRVRVHSGADGQILNEITGYRSNDRMGRTLCPMYLNADASGDLIAGAPLSAYSSTTHYAGWARFVLGDAPYPSPYCTAKVNSLGCVPSIGFTGCASLSVGDNLHVHAANVLPNVAGILIWSLEANGAPFQGGTLCVRQPIRRTPLQFSSADGTGTCTGTYVRALSQATLTAGGATAGADVFAQYWSRDAGFAPPNNSGLTGGLRIPVLP